MEARAALGVCGGRKGGEIGVQGVWQECGSSQERKGARENRVNAG
jgi:hypothetical protein